MRQFEMKRPKRPELEKALKSVACDLCGKKGFNVQHDEGVNWTNEGRVENITTIAHKVGERYFPDGAEFKTEFFDICDKCFSEKLKPWLISQGANPQQSAFEY